MTGVNAANVASVSCSLVSGGLARNVAALSGPSSLLPPLGHAVTRH